MALYRYRAVDPYGEPLEGTMEENSAARVTAILQERGAQVNEVLEVGRPAKKFGAQRPLGWADVALLNDQLLAIVRGKIPVAPSVQAMAKDLDNRRLKPVFDHLRSDLEAGRSLEEALQRSPRALPPIYLSLVRAGERSGNLSGVLEMITAYSTRLLGLRERISAAMVYPVFVVLTLIGVMTFLLYNVVPQYVEMFNEFGGMLPAPTRLLADLSHAVRSYPIQLGAGLLFVAAGIAAVRVALRANPVGRSLRDRLRQRMPVVGRMYRIASLARFSKALGLMLEAGVPIGEALDLAGAAAANEHLRDAVRRAGVHVAQGERVADALSDTRCFPHSFLWFVANGESREQLAATLRDLSETYEREVSVRDEVLIHLLVPATILALGAMVLFVVFALYAPLFRVGDALSG